MNNSLTKVALTLTTVFSFSALALPAAPLMGDSNESIWNQYCKVQANGLPTPNYKNAEVDQAAQILSEVSNYSFYFYSGPVKAYGLKGLTNEQLPSDFPQTPLVVKDGFKNAHTFLTVLCGEFKDRATMVREKIRWIHNLYLLPAESQKPFVTNKNIWSQVTAESYLLYIKVSDMVWNFKKMSQLKDTDVGGPGLMKLGDYVVDKPVDGQTICETKYIFKEYVEKLAKMTPQKVQATLSSIGEKHFKQYMAGYESFQKQCSSEDLNYYYDFRGDSNFKPNSPESNAMIWHSSSITNNCKSMTEESGSKLQPGTCKAYFEKPFETRWNAARSGLATWLLRDAQHDPVFSAEGDSVRILSYKNDGAKSLISSEPFRFLTRMGEFDVANLSASDFAKNDFGFNTLYASPSKAYERIRDAVNRHTDWYSSGYDDGRGLQREQAYSPFVASSYEMSKSDGFTAPGVTVNSPSDGCKHWMFVFKVKKDNWYNVESLKKGKQIDFDTQWFDETSFGTNHLADTERAWDRMGTAIEGEYDSILYLHNINTAGQVQAGCGKQ